MSAPASKHYRVIYKESWAWPANEEMCVSSPPRIFAGNPGLSRTGRTVGVYVLVHYSFWVLPIDADETHKYYICCTCESQGVYPLLEELNNGSIIDASFVPHPLQLEHDECIIHSIVSQPPSPPPSP